MESGLYIPKAGGITPRSNQPDATKPQTSPVRAPGAAAKGSPEAAADSPAPASAVAISPVGAVIHKNLADRLKAAKVPGHAGSQDSPAGEGAAVSVPWDSSMRPLFALL